MRCLIYQQLNCPTIHGFSKVSKSMKSTSEFIKLVYYWDEQTTPCHQIPDSPWDHSEPCTKSLKSDMNKSYFMGNMVYEQYVKFSVFEVELDLLSK